MEGFLPKGGQKKERGGGVKGGSWGSQTTMKKLGEKRSRVNVGDKIVSICKNEGGEGGGIRRT